jgi:hypothetical protein
MLPNSPTSEAASTAAPPDGDRSPSAVPTTLLYTLCSPHSGSTILGIGLASHPDVFFAGELFDIPEPGWIPGHECSCGKAAADCPFWGAVQRDVAAAMRLQDLIDDQRWYWRWRSVPPLAVARVKPTAKIAQRANRLRILIESIARRSGRRIIIDTSKMPSRALTYSLLESDRFQVKYLHLVRNPGPEIISRIGSDKRHYGAARPYARIRYAFRWIVANLSFLVLFARRRRYLRIRYEDLLQDPRRGIERIGHLLGIDLREIGDRASSGYRFPVGHVLRANRIMFDGSVAFRRAETAAPAPLSQGIPKPQSGPAR